MGIDTGAFIARYLTNDKYHKKALKIWQTIANKKLKCFTSNFVLDETFTLLGRWCDYHFAADKANIIYSSDIFTVLRPNQSDELTAIEIFKKFADQKVSYTDCISFALMKSNNLKKVFTPDKCRLVNLMLSYEFINDYNMFKTFIQSLI